MGNKSLFYSGRHETFHDNMFNEQMIFSNRNRNNNTTTKKQKKKRRKSLCTSYT